MALGPSLAGLAVLTKATPQGSVRRSGSAVRAARFERLRALSTSLVHSQRTNLYWGAVRAFFL